MQQPDVRPRVGLERRRLLPELWRCAVMSRAYMRKIQEIRRSNAAAPIPNRKQRRRMSRNANRQADIRDQEN
ncbi:hypothetical protein SEA_BRUTONGASTER_143 [Gordonia phage BrutonGaster]|uniref:Uncharacterized protein n=1 Tax=Gordonia phage BrutonGaster TaxID=2530116 RepID=A0A482JKX2_9CAUD|nr:hypothetical protein HOV26_gp039 [Gordonia phage BrutonGaster]QBP33356.1 hypothetical protein SEA_BRUTONGASTER_143 [Gordonia phage BrutonGaster]